MSSKIRVLIIDDNVGVRVALNLALASKPNLEVIASGAQKDSAVQLVASLQPDVVIMEPKSLNGQGYQTCKDIVESEYHPVVITLTSYYDDQEALILAELGASRYLLKDIDTQSLYEEILLSYAERTQHAN